MKKKLTEEEALEQARRDPRQTSLFGEDHTVELTKLQRAVKKIEDWKPE
jgi:hypothetical protein